MKFLIVLKNNDMKKMFKWSMCNARCDLRCNEFFRW